MFKNKLFLSLFYTLCLINHKTLEARQSDNWKQTATIYANKIISTDKQQHFFKLDDSSNGFGFGLGYLKNNLEFGMDFYSRKEIKNHFYDEKFTLKIRPILFKATYYQDILENFSCFASVGLGPTKIKNSSIAASLNREINNLNSSTRISGMLDLGIKKILSENISTGISLELFKIKTIELSEISMSGKEATIQNELKKNFRDGIKINERSIKGFIKMTF
jgi:hypothetical protein